MLAVHIPMLMGVMGVMSVAVACGAGNQGASSPATTTNTTNSPSMMGSPPPSSPPTPLPSDWKGLFDSDSQSHSTAPPAPESVADVLRKEPTCSRVESSGTASFSGAPEQDTVYLLACGAAHRIVIVNAKRVKLASLDVPEDVIYEAGDLDLDGDRELLAIGHTSSRITVRVLGLEGAKLTTVYSYTINVDPCAHTIIIYHTGPKGLEFREDTSPKRCTP